MDQNDKILKIRKSNRVCRNPYYYGMPFLDLPYNNNTSVLNHNNYCSDHNRLIKSTLNNSFEKKVMMTNLTYHKYNLKDFIKDMLNELDNYPEEMYKLNPDRVLRGHSGCTLKDISSLWGHHDGYVSERLMYHLDNLEYFLPNKNLNELENNLKIKFGRKAEKCCEIIDLHKAGLISLDKFINKIQIELGKITKSVNTTLEDLVLIFGYGYGMMSYIRNNNSYLLSKERLSIISNNLKSVLGNKAQNALKIVKKYKQYNPNLPDYANQKYTITNPHLFSDIYKNFDAMYWFGWLCSDGWASQIGNVHYQIQLKLKRMDRIIVENFATAVGYDLNRIFDETYLFKNENGTLRKIYSSRVFFGCKPMWLDLKQLGFFEFKNNGKVPHIIQDLIDGARNKNPNGQLIETKQGCLALNFLIGFYDGDGSYRGGMSAIISNSKKEFLDEISILYNSPNETKVNGKKVIDEETGKIVWKTRYRLSLGPELFRQMLLSYKNSLQRKRPKEYKKILY
ncbi:MAG: hypothetical protein ACFFAO_14630 [Candidatus Hermodarchaeota archaeon]